MNPNIKQKIRKLVIENKFLSQLLFFLPINLFPIKVGRHIAQIRELISLNADNLIQNGLQSYRLPNGDILYAPTSDSNNDHLPPHINDLMRIITGYVYPPFLPTCIPPYSKEIRPAFGRFTLDCPKDVLNDLNEINTFNDRFTLRSDSLLIDCGCYLGYGSVHGARILKTGHVLAIEADDLNYDIALKNFISNSLNNVRLVKMAAFSHNGTIEFMAHEHTNLPQRAGGGIKPSSLKSQSHGVEAQRTISVECGRIDDVIGNDIGLYNHILINITTNGSEYDILLGLEKTLSSNAKIGINTIIRDTETFTKVKSYLENFRFKVIRGESYRTLAIR